MQATYQVLNLLSLTGAQGTTWSHPCSLTTGDESALPYFVRSIILPNSQFLKIDILMFLTSFSSQRVKISRWHKNINEWKQLTFLCVLCVWIISHGSNLLARSRVISVFDYQRFVNEKLEFVSARAHTPKNVNFVFTSFIFLCHLDIFTLCLEMMLGT